MDFYGYGYGSYYGGWHYGGAEKSRYSKNREDTAKEKFNKLKGKMEAAMIENTVLELRDPKSEADIKSIPTVLMNNILTFVFGKKYEGLEAEAESEDGKAQVVELAKSARAGRRARKKVNYSELNIDNCGNDNKKVSKTEVESGVDFNDMSLYQPGSKITLELAKPNFHLTQPCFRDLRKHVKKNPGWDLQRVSISEEEKKEFKPKITRKSTAYYVNAVYKVPGVPKKKKTSGSAGGKKATGSKKRKAKAEPAAKPPPKADPVATAALQAAIASARSNDKGKIGAKQLREAMDAGFSKFYILARAALPEEEVHDDEEEGVVDAKPAAKKTKKTAKKGKAKKQSK